MFTSLRVLPRRCWSGLALVALIVAGAIDYVALAGPLFGAWD